MHIHQKFRRRTKTQAMRPCADAVPLPRFALLMSRSIHSRTIDGWQNLQAIMSTRRKAP